VIRAPLAVTGDRRAIVRGPCISGQKPQKTAKNPRSAPRRPRGWQAGARAMFFSNNIVKNDMDVSRETLPIFCAVVRGLLTA